MDNKKTDFSDRRKYPYTLKDAVDMLIVNTGNEDKEYIKSISEDQFTAEAHNFTGRNLRNNWHLWWRRDQVGKYEDYPDSIPKIVEHFRNMGIYHAKDMSGIILTCFYRELNGHEWKTEEQVKEYQKYWSEQNTNFLNDKGL